MAYCGPRGIPLDRFLAWPQDSQDAALAWQAHEARRCGQCGTHLDDWKEDEGGDRHAWHAEQYTCPGCQRLERLNESLSSKKPGPGVHTRLSSGREKDCSRCNPPDAEVK